MRPLKDCVVLHVEDDDATAYLLQYALREENLFPQLFRVSDGAQALAFLGRQEVYCQAPRPELVLLDLNLPGIDGFTALQEIRSNPAWDDIVIFAFSSSNRPEDREQALRCGADDYLWKGSDLHTFSDAVRRICELLGSGPVQKTA